GVDTMLGGAGDDYIDGGRGLDYYNGGDGADNFVFRSIADMGVGAAARDQIRDFDAAEGDRVNLYLIDANTTIAGNQAFAITSGYSGAGGELVLFDFVVSGVDVTVASMDVDGDSVTDAQIYIVGGADAGDFVL
ncbi:hypothetical protein J1C49_21345, partial [Cognatishimia sp. F0-27]|nr:hypothetical protein [Cognatishimia sp. F0-27]